MGYLNGIRGGIFNSPKEKKVFISKHVIFLENDYVIRYKDQSKVVLEELTRSSSSSPPTKVVDLREREEFPSSSYSVRVIEWRDEQTTIPNQNIQEPHRSGRTIKLS